MCCYLCFDVCPVLLNVNKVLQYCVPCRYADCDRSLAAMSTYRCLCHVSLLLFWSVAASLVLMVLFTVIDQCQTTSCCHSNVDTHFKLLGTDSSNPFCELLEPATFVHSRLHVNWARVWPVGNNVVVEVTVKSNLQSINICHFSFW
jgi:hypothetical protein